MSERLQPQYYVKHPDDSYSVADPQPVYIPEGETVTWKNMGPEEIRWGVLPAKQALLTQIKQLRFIVDQAPMMNAPEGLDALSRLNNSVIPYIYINPKTWEAITISLFSTGTARPKYPYYRISRRCPTRFVPTDLIPEGRMLCTPNKIPGIEGI